MKNIILVIITSFFGLKGFAQYTEPVEHKEKKEETHGFQKDHLFTGGGLQLAFSNYDFVVGASPVLGYSFNKWFDAGIGFSYIHIAEREAYQDQFGNVYTTGNKIRQNDYAPLAFVKFYPLKFLFIQAQFEENFITQKYIYGYGAPTEKISYNVSSLLPGIGYASGREDVGDFYYFISISIDVLKNRKSPYVQLIGDNVNFLPILRAGIQVPLFQGRK
ncbi:MAG: hypothetical protein ABI402_00850 [Ferruginibacter sp.]